MSYFRWKLPFEHTFVTGYECKGREQEPKLHTWVEFEQNGKEKVLDYTMNVIMDKTDYYTLMHINKICATIKDSEIKKHFTQESFKQLESYYDLKYVLTSWEKVLEEMNVKLFEKNKCR